MNGGAVPDGLSYRWTPDPYRVRQAVVGVCGTGLYIGFAGALVQLVAVHFTVSADMAARWQLGMLAGGIVGAFVGRWVGRSSAGVRGAMTAGVVSATAGLSSISVLPAVEWAAFSAGLLGLAIGTTATAASYSLDGVLVSGRAAGALDLASAWFGLGAAAGCLLFWGLQYFFTLGAATLAVGVLLFLGSSAIRMSGSVSAKADWIAPSHHWHDVLRPTRVLISIGLTLQAALWGVAAYWLGFYVNRNLGVTPSWSLVLVALFWLGWVSGRTGAGRMLRVGLFRAALAAAVCGFLACLFLANTIELSGAIVGAVLLGASSGVLQGLFQRMAGEQEATLAMVGRFFSGAAMTSLASAAMTGVLIELFGVGLVIWTAASIGTALCICLGVLAVESRLARSPAEA